MGYPSGITGTVAVGPRWLIHRALASVPRVAASSCGARHDLFRESPMRFEGGCYCGEVRYVAEGEPRLEAQCHCRECQYISGGAPNMFMLMPPDGFRYAKGQPKQFSRSDLEQPVTREFCGNCGTHLTTRRPGLPAVILKVGTLDDPSLFKGPRMAIYTVDKQPFHVIPEGLPAYERLPQR
jgi:hypothetical protein